MPDPNAHADDMKSTAKPETMPSFWWLEPWTFAVEQWKARAKYYRYWQLTEAQRELAIAEASAKTLRINVTEQNIVDTANAAGFEASKAGYAINGQPRSPFPLNWLGEAVAYWKGEAYAARRERDDALADVEDLRCKAKTLDSLIADIEKATPSSCIDGHGPVGWMKNAAADLEQARKDHAEEHAANVRLQQELAEVRSRLDAAIFAFKKPAKRKPKAKKKGGRK